MSKRTALITGILGQDGAYLARIALREGYQVIGSARNLHLPEKKWRLQQLGVAQDIVYQETDLNDQESVNRAIQTHQPELVFNLAAQSSVATSFKLPYETLNSTLMGAARIFEAVRQFAPEARVFQPLSSEARSSSSPYAAAKACAKLIADLYRERYGLFISTAILHNHESPLRDTSFVSRKIVWSLSRIQRGLEKQLLLGNLNSLRYWSHAKDIMEGTWKALQKDAPGHYVLTSDQVFSVREFASKCAAQLSLPIEWCGKELGEVGYVRSGEPVISVDPAFYRPTDPMPDRTGASETETELDWKPTTSVDELIKEMLEFEFTNLNGELT